MSVVLGTTSLSVNNVPYTQGFTQGTVTWTAGTTGTALVQFQYLTGADNAGLIVDDVVLTATGGGIPGTPIPPTVLLSALGVALLAGYYAWHRARRAIN
jgi:hypothetical protein